MINYLKFVPYRKFTLSLLLVLNGFFLLLYAPANETYASATVVTSGLEFYLLSSNPSSYPGNGDEWFDLSGNGTSPAIIKSGVTFNATSGLFEVEAHTKIQQSNYIRYVDTGSGFDVSRTSGFTVEVTYQLPGALYPWGPIWGNENYSTDNGYTLVYFSATNLTFFGGNDSANGLSITPDFSLSGLNTYSVTVEPSGINVLASIYVNGSLRASGIFTPPGVPNETILLNSRYDNGDNNKPGQDTQQANLSMFRYYSRALTAEEILQNYQSDGSIEVQKTMTFETNGGTAVAPITGVVGSAVSISTTRDGFTFDGWYLDAGLTQTAGNLSTIPNQDTTYYAKWVAVPVTPPAPEPPSPPVNYVFTPIRIVSLAPRLKIDAPDEVTIGVYDDYDLSVTIYKIRGYAKEELLIDYEVDQEISTAKIGSYKITILSRYEDLEATKEVVINIIDTTPPEVIEPDLRRVTFGQPLDLSDINVTDNYDTNPSITYTVNGNPQMPGTYQVDYVVTDQSGNETRFSKTVVVELPVIHAYRVEVGQQVLYYLINSKDMDLESLRVDYQFMNGSLSSTSDWFAADNVCLLEEFNEARELNTRLTAMTLEDARVRIRFTDRHGNELIRESIDLASLTLNQTCVDLNVKLDRIFE